MKWLLIALLALVGSVAVAIVALPDPGYVLLAYGNYSVETSLLVLAAVLVLMYVGVRLLAGLWRVPAQLDNWSQRRRDRRLQRWYDDAVRALAEGRAERAERWLSRLLKSQSAAPLQAYLAAAQAASQRGDGRTRDRYLQLALQRQPESEATILIQQAELQLSAAQTDQAQTTLARAHKLLPQNARVLRLQMQLYLQQRDWARLRDLLPELRRSRVLAQADWQKLAIQVYREQLLGLSSAADLADLSSSWKQLPSPVQEDQGLLAVYIEQLLRLGAHQQAGKLVRQQLRRFWDPRLVYLFGDIRETDVVAQLSQAERWLEKHPGDAVLLLSLGKISLRNRLWGKARSYLEDSISRQPMAETYQFLATLLEQLDEAEAAAECYRKGLALNVLPQATGSLASLDSSADDSATLPVSRSA